MGCEGCKLQSPSSEISKILTALLVRFVISIDLTSCDQDLKVKFLPCFSFVVKLKTKENELNLLRVLQTSTHLGSVAQC